MEVCYVDKTSPDGIKQSKENFAVGGRNRWSYKSFKNWYFVPNKDFPVFMYFSETQTKPEGQFHLFPVIMNGQVGFIYLSCYYHNTYISKLRFLIIVLLFLQILYEKMMEKIGSLNPTAAN